MCPQSINVPLAFDKEGSDVPVRRYVAQLNTLGQKAGFQDPVTEVQKRLVDASAVADTVKVRRTAGLPAFCCRINGFDGF